MSPEDAQPNVNPLEPQQWCSAGSMHEAALQLWLSTFDLGVLRVLDQTYEGCEGSNFKLHQFDIFNYMYMIISTYLYIV